MLTIIHGADFHLDSPFSGLTPDQAAQRRQEQRELLDRLADLSKEKQADLVLLSGDLLDGDRVYRETAQTLARALGSIPCPVFIAPGNHDYYSPRSVYATLEWPENVHIFRSAEIERVDLPRLNCSVYGRAFTTAHLEVGPLANFRAADNGQLKLMCLHGDTAPVSDYGPISSADILASGLDYLALGHIHQCSGLQREGNTFWAYPGCPEGRGFDELGEKGVLCVQAEPGNVTAQFVPLCRYQYEIRSLDLTGAEDPQAAILAALPADTQHHTCRLTLTGETEAFDCRALAQALAPRFYGLTLTDRTRLPQDLWKRREEDTLIGLFLRAMWAKCQEDPDEPLYQLAARFGLAALEDGEDIAL